MSSPDLLDPADPAQARALRPWLAFQSVFCFRPDLAVALLREHGDPERALHASGVPPAPAEELERWLATLRRVGARGLPLASPAYPACLARYPDAAPLLFVQGEARALAGPGLAIVGSRAATRHGLALAHEFAAVLAGAGLVVISGLARGIDAAAHQGALDGGGRTLAVQACGPDLVYPAAHRKLAARIDAQGARVTEFLPGTPPRAPHFPLRNRLISGLAAGLLVIEARERSGTLVTTAHAAAQGIDVFALPGPVGSAACAGSNRLLRDGAHVALEPEDVLCALRLAGVRASPLPETRTAAPPEPVRERPLSAAILTALERAPAHRDELARLLSREPQQLALEILELELAGRIREERDGRFRVVSPRAARGL
jgi:DNA processing protein